MSPRAVVARLLSLLRRRAVERELEEEIQAHLEQAEQDNLRAGMSPEEARWAARRSFGGVEQMKEAHRDVGGFRPLADVAQDVRLALRSMVKQPAFTVVAVLTLALGMGANTAIFSVVNSLLLRALPVAEPQRLVTVSADTVVAYPWTYAVWDGIRQRAEAFDGAFAWAPAQFDLAHGGERRPIDGLFASGDFFTTLGVTALLGRTFTPADDERGGGPGGPVAVISFGLWQRRFGGAASVIGTRLVVEGVPFTIIGVTPPEFFGPEVGRAFDVALPLGTEPLIRGEATSLDERHAYWLTVMLRLKLEQSLEVATATLRGMQPQIREGALPHDEPPGGSSDLDKPFTLVPAAAGTSGLREQYEQPLIAILVVVALVLLIACANVANLLLARATARRHEVSVRVALGASRWRLVRQLLVESLILASIGAVIGLFIAALGSRALVAGLSTSVSRVVLDVSLDWRVLLFTAAVAVVSGVLFGIVPACRATRAAPIDALKEPAFALRATAGWPGLAGAGRGPSGFVVVQIALSLVLVVAAGLFVRTFQRLASVPLGFDSDRVLVVNVDATRVTIDPANRHSFYHRLVEAVDAVPGVAHVAGSDFTPASGGHKRFPVDVPGGPSMPLPERRVRANDITPGWFATYGTPIRAGRDFDERDTMNAPPVAVVNEAFARKFFPGRSALGGTVAELSPPGSDDAPVPKTIVGVVSDAVYRTPRDGVEPTLYEPLMQQDGASTDIGISVRASSGSPVSLARSVAAALTAVDRNLAFSFRPLADQVNASFAQERLVALLSGLFGALAVLLAGIGLYGVTSYAVTRRQHEIGIRMALGAERSDVMRLVLARSAAMTGVGIVLGLAAAAVTTRYLEAMLFGVTPLDPTTFLAVSLMFAAVAMFAAFLPARRATKLDPLVVLRSE